MSVQPEQGAPLSAVVASNVRAEAARRGLNQSDMARLLGVSRMAMSDRYRCRTPWTLDELELVARHFGLPVVAFLVTSGANLTSRAHATAVGA